MDKETKYKLSEFMRLALISSLVAFAFNSWFIHLGGAGLPNCIENKWFNAQYFNQENVYGLKTVNNTHACQSARTADCNYGVCINQRIEYYNCIPACK